MKCFKTISTSFIVVIAVIFCCNVYYLVRLYNSIRNDVEREVMTAIADADLDELWVRAQRAQAGTLEYLEEKNGDGGERPHGETSVYQDSAGDMVATTRHPDGTVETQGYAVNGQSSFTNKPAVSRHYRSLCAGRCGGDGQRADEKTERQIYVSFLCFF